MNCKSCNYPLWNVRDRRCPECGVAFFIRDFIFNVNSVQFKCPHCAQSYYGLNPDNGHLVPAEFDCVQCDQHISMEMMVLLPTEGVEEKQTVGDMHPLLETNRSYLMRWLRTLGASCFTPRRLIGLTGPELSTWAVIGYFATTMLLTSLVGPGSIVLAVAFIGRSMGTGDIVYITLACLGGALGITALLWLWMLTINGALALTGPWKGAKRTVQCVCLSSGPLILAGTPCLAFHMAPVALVWWLINACVMIAAGHKVHAGRAILAGCVLPILMLAVLAICIAYVALS
jgi:predicted RNA-binding Zn-ribbon protein involved in translation (DUF1610 family)